jgi:hypothetical protein
MLPLGLLLKLLAWAAFAIAGVGLFFWAARWFPRQRWLASTLALLFLLLGLLARESKWAVVALVLLLVVGSAFIPRKRSGRVGRD